MEIGKRYIIEMSVGERYRKLTCYVKDKDEHFIYVEDKFGKSLQLALKDISIIEEVFEE